MLTPWTPIPTGPTQPLLAAPATGLAGDAYDMSGHIYLPPSIDRRGLLHD